MSKTISSIEYPPEQYPFKIKNWDKFQHYRKRSKPPWIRFYRSLLDDPDWHALEPLASKVLAMCWLLAAESDGYLPIPRKIAFRLRMGEEAVLSQIYKLNQWIDDRANVMLALCEHGAIPDTDTDTDKKDILVHPPNPAAVPPAYPPEFQEFWLSYPKRDGSNPKHLAYKAYRAAIKSGTEPAAILEGASRLAQSFAGKPNGERRFIPQASTWLNQRRWLDDCEAVVSGGGFSV